MGGCGFYLDSGDGEFLDEQQLAEPGTDACLVQYELLVDLGQVSTACCMQCRLAMSASFVAVVSCSTWIFMP